MGKAGLDYIRDMKRQLARRLKGVDISRIGVIVYGDDGSKPKRRKEFLKFLSSLRGNRRNGKRLC